MSSNIHPRHRWPCMQSQECPVCFKRFSNSFNLKQHNINVHVQSPGVQCHICAKVVKNKWYLRKHEVTAHGAPLKRAKDKINKAVVEGARLPEEDDEDVEIVVDDDDTTESKADVVKTADRGERDRNGEET